MMRFLIAAGIAFAFPTLVNAQPVASALPSPFSAYLELYAGWNEGSESGSFTNTSYHDQWNESFGGLDARGALAVNPMTVLQFDAWAQQWNGHEVDHTCSPTCSGDAYDYSGQEMGYGVHLSFRNLPDTQWGFLASLGSFSYDDGQLGNLGVEAAHDFAQWRLYGQAGYTFSLNDTSLPPDWYGALAATFYPDPNFSLTAGVVADTDSGSGGSESGLDWYGRVEHKLGSFPVTVYAEYIGSTFSGRNDLPDHWTGSSQSALVGVRFMFGQPTVRALDQAVGLTDFNPYFGKSF